MRELTLQNDYMHTFREENLAVSAIAVEREGNNVQGFNDLCLKNGASQGQNLALTVLCVPNCLDNAQQCRHDSQARR